MKVYHTISYITFSLLIVLFTFYSYVLVDPNLTIASHPAWVWAREQFVYIGYYQRPLSTALYGIFVLGFFIFHRYFVRRYKEVNLWMLIGILAFAGIISYPFLSHDFFNYMFDAKIITYYHQNPYLMKALDFPVDPWLRFMHWTHRTYPYGPVFLILTLVPSFFSFGKFLAGFLLFKLYFFLFFCLGAYVLNKLNKKWAVIFATHPLVLVEGLVISHNDLIAVALAFVGVYHLFKKKHLLWGRLFLLLSAGIKYLTIPAILIHKDKKYRNAIALASIVILITYISFTGEVQPWYFLNLLIFIPFYEDIINKLWIFFAGLLLSYYPFILEGDWKHIGAKHVIIMSGLLINAVYLAMLWRKKAYSF